jgi:hypothetical protein
MSDAAIPADDPNRKLTVAEPDTPTVRHVASWATRTASSFLGLRPPGDTA